MKLDFKGGYQFLKEIIKMFGLIMFWSLIIIILFGGTLHIEMKEGILVQVSKWIIGLFY